MAVEGVGIAVGVAALFNTCVDGFKIVFAAQDFARDFEVLNASFQQQRLRLFLWGENVGLISRRGVKMRPYFHKLDQQHVRPTIMMSLESIRYLLDRFELHESRYGLKIDVMTSLVNVSATGEGRFDERTKKNQKQKSARMITKWAVFDADKMKETNERLKDLIDGLINITNELRTMQESDDKKSAKWSTPASIQNLKPAIIQAQGNSSLVSTVSRQINALDLQSSLETFYSTREMLRSIETFVSALETESQSQPFFSAESVVQDPTPHEYFDLDSLTQATYDLPLSERTDDSQSIDTYTFSSTSSGSVISASEAVVPPAEDSPTSLHNSPWFTQDVIPSTPRDFSDLFPTDRKILIGHDDATIDGNMNLRIYTPTKNVSQKIMYISLFHLRMHDIKAREFSFRRYCRESGREVCHSMLRFKRSKSRKSKPGGFLSRSNQISSKVAYKRSGFRERSQSQDSTNSKMSWFGRRSSRSSHASNASESDHDRGRDGAVNVVAELVSTNKISLEFSNYARIDLERRGRRSQKRYAFEYWGKNYTWKRTLKESKEVWGNNYTWRTIKDNKEYRDCNQHSLLLYIDGTSLPLARIDPVSDEAVLEKESLRGGWVPPCEMRFLDEKAMESIGDIGDVVISTGVIALVDNAIRSQFTTSGATRTSAGYPMQK